MIESYAIAYLKEFFIAFMLFLIPILTYDANSVIFYIQNEVFHASNVVRQFSIEKVQGDLDREKERFQVASQDLTGFQQRVFLVTRK